MQPITSTRPYLVRAIYEWIVDNNFTPHLLVNAEEQDVEVPLKYVQDGKIILNISPTAIRDLELGNEWISFNARFSGTPFNVFVPVYAVLAIYARENGQGLVFQEEPASPPPESAPSSEKSSQPPEAEKQKGIRPPRGKPVLRRIK